MLEGAQNNLNMKETLTKPDENIDSCWKGVLAKPIHNDLIDLIQFDRNDLMDPLNI